MAKVTTIPATISRFTATPIHSKKKRRVAGYARVSTDHEDQATSYEAQVDYYTNYIKSRDDWEFVSIYTDEGISATNTKKREGFKAMIADALSGKIDLIITKSVSRFARNTVDSLTTVRQLKDAGIEIYFEKENIWTLDSKGELLITIMSSLAQEESRSISENVTWGQRKRMADGKVSFAYSRFMGLDKDKETGKIVVNPEQAEVVRLIFRMFLEGLTPHSIAAELTSRGIKTPGGKDVWNQQTVRRMLSNEKYKGDALLQKEFTVDFLQKKMKKNEGEVPQYYVEGNHEAIISPAVFDMVQAELARRKEGGTRYSGVSIFSNKIKCADCGGWYGSKVWHSTDSYRKVIYRCNRKYNGEKCQTPHVTEDEIKAAFVSACNRLVTEKKEIIANAEVIRKTLCVTTALQEEKSKLGEEMAVLVEMTQNIVAENARVAQDQDEYQKRYDGLVQRYDAAKARYDEVVSAISAKEAQSERLSDFIKVLKAQDGTISEFDGSLWGSMVEFVTVGRDKEITVTFRDGTEIQA
ncbi:MAG TPA: recombinase family protein [Candidatus Gallacutalibacter pullicola]|uniref:Recombinase family protein n=1 Tax=Candidatus Gallacutalibacter pullicola TaxID=2840830 RepID=A0A9D1DP27_9FIRM|nr:recombinase family protein [Candidatus Gallacutalibacter pullicola]